MPDSLRPQAAQLVGEKLGGERVATLPAPSDGRFAFGNLAAGDYVVKVLNASGDTVAQSQVARVQPETSVEARFDEDQLPVAVYGTGSGPSKALLIAGAAAIVGIGTAIVIAARPASPSR